MVLRKRGAPALRSSLWSSSGPTPTAPCPCCVGSPRTGCGTPGGVSQQQSRGQNHLPHPAGHASLDAAQDMVGPLGFKHTLPAHAESSINRHHHSPPMPYLCLGLPLPRYKTLYLALLNFMRLAWTHISSLPKIL